MKSSTEIFATIMAILIFTGCGVRPATATTTSPTTTELYPLPKPAQSDRPSADSAPPRAADGFAIYLLVPNALTHGFTGIGPSELEGDPFLTTDEIVSYGWATHEIELTDGAYERIHNLATALQGEGFAVCVDRQPIYAGAIWNGYSSSVFEGPTIDLVHPTREHPVIQIRLGYPTPAFFRGDDRRSDPRIFQALEEAGKLN